MALFKELKRKIRIADLPALVVTFKSFYGGYDVYIGPKLYKRELTLYGDMYTNSAMFDTEFKQITARLLLLKNIKNTGLRGLDELVKNYDGMRELADIITLAPLKKDAN